VACRSNSCRRPLGLCEVVAVYVEREEVRYPLRGIVIGGNHQLPPVCETDHPQPMTVPAAGPNGADAAFIERGNDWGNARVTEDRATALRLPNRDHLAFSILVAMRVGTACEAAQGGALAHAASPSVVSRLFALRACRTKSPTADGPDQVVPASWSA